MSTFIPANFIIQELVPPEIYRSRGARAWELLCPYALRTLQTLRDVFGPTTVNNWHVGGQYQESGLRGFATSTGAALSQHKFGRAFDCKFRNTTPREAFDYVLAHPDRFPYLTALEDVRFTPTWLHFDTRNHNQGDIWIVRP